jgi:hypothetical protein
LGWWINWLCRHFPWRRRNSTRQSSPKVSLKTSALVFSLSLLLARWSLPILSLTAFVWFIGIFDCPLIITSAADIPPASLVCFQKTLERFR